ncbi:MAG: hypothetical protein ACE5ID_11885, partial [Acidobacteriota bacterium]
RAKTSEFKTRIQQELAGTRSEVAAREEELARLEEAYTLRLAAADQAAQEAEEHRSRLLAAVGQQGEARNRAMQLEERGRQMKQRRERLQKEKQSCAAEKEEGSRLLEESSARLQVQTRVAEEAAAACGAGDQRLEQAAAAKAKAVENLSEARNSLAALKEREAALAALWESPAGDTETVSVGVPLGQGVEVRPQWEGAAGNWLGRLLNARLVEHLQTALEFLEKKVAAGGEHCDLIVPELMKRPQSSQAESLDGVLDGHREHARLLAAAAGNPELVEDLSTAVARFRAQPGRAFLTQKGLGITRSGVLTGGGRQQATRLLAGNRQRREASLAAAALKARLPALERQAREAEERRQQAAAGAEAARRERETRARDLIESRSHHQRHLEEAARLERRWEVIESEAAVLTQEEAVHQHDLEVVQREQEAAETARREAEDTSREVQNNLEDVRRQIQTLAGERAELKSKHAARREALTALEQEVKRLHGEVARLKDRRQTCETESRQQRAATAALREEKGRMETCQASLGREIMLLNDRCQADEMSLQEIRDLLPELEAEARRAREVGEKIRTRHQAKEVERAQARAHQEDLERHCMEQFQCTPDALEAGLSE